METTIAERKAWTAAEIRVLRARRGDSLSAFGRALGCAHSLVRYWERGDGHPTWRYLCALDALDAETAQTPTE